jgi:ubiquinone biosynthesis protein UbiJ
MNDVAGGAAILIDPSQPETAARMIAEGLRDTTRLRSDGLRNAASYTAERMFEECEALYRETATAARSQPR